MVWNRGQQTYESSNSFAASPTTSYRDETPFFFPPISPFNSINPDALVLQNETFRRRLFMSNPPAENADHVVENPRPPTPWPTYHQYEQQRPLYPTPEATRDAFPDQSVKPSDGFPASLADQHFSFDEIFYSDSEVCVLLNHFIIIDFWSFVFRCGQASL